MTGLELVTAMTEILVGGITQIASGLGTGISTLVTNLAMTGTGADATLSPFFSIILAFGGVALALGLCYAIFNLIRTLGN